MIEHGKNNIDGRRILGRNPFGGFAGGHVSADWLRTRSRHGETVSGYPSVNLWSIKGVPVLGVGGVGRVEKQIRILREGFGRVINELVLPKNDVVAMG